ncbi:Sensor histidine kinase TmoS [Fundidesulfovibrio magnetotacticus]|uniref:histidine kinase n=1 Tax=Fundidesulfovibrio magnetotacticus TaxID=2730080 RepID=A0A6V8LW14_9BACT|nr:ATP-binding protein [Fundidesulfovibrio magnetotacticus]GFK93857.1 Sensor histidine kinase TmoS [Fundidesulfovibrio magnetotacticus]
MDDPKARIPTSRIVLALAIPLLAFALQWTFWAAIKPYAWFLFFPAVFFSSWAGGLPGGLAATLLSTALATFFFIAPDLKLLLQSPIGLVSIGMFMCMGVLFSLSHDRLRRANLRVAKSLAQVTEANSRIHEANQQITRLYEKTRELDELKTQFFANVSHELRTPLALILGPVENTLARRDLPEQVQRDLEMARRNAGLLHRHVDDLLDVAKLEAGSMVLNYAELDLARLIRLTASHFESLAKDNGTLLSLSFPDELPAQVDAQKCQRIVLNLLSNAFKFTPPGGRVELSLEQREGSAVLHVRDNGPGVPPDLREAVFERFRQVDGGTQRLHGGTGLGLAIVRELAQLHGGSVTLDEAPGGGAQFSVTLPLAAPPGTTMLPAPELLDEEPARQVVEEQRVHTGHKPSGSAGTSPDAPLILVAEDNPDMSMFIRSTLSPRFRVAAAEDGREALDMALALKPDLILSDVMMPGASGSWLVRELRLHPEMDDVPVVMLTAKADDALRVELLRSGAQDYVTKPFSSEELLARVEGLLRERSRHETALRAFRKRFRDTFEHAAVGIAHVAADGAVLLVNQKLCDIMGRTREQLMQAAPRDLLHPGCMEEGKRLVATLLESGQESLCLETRWLRPGDVPLWTLVTATLVRDDAGAPDYFIAVVEDIQRRKRAEEDIRHSLCEKEMLLREIHHRVKNNLQIIMSLVNLQAADTEDPKELERAETLDRRIHSMALVHEQLYRTSDFAAVDLANYIRDLAGKLAQTFDTDVGKACLEIETCPLSIGIDKAVPFGLLLNELITNAFKHAAPGRGGWTLRITLERQGSQALLAVQDSGPGFPPGFDPENQKSLGFQLVMGLVHQIAGKLAIPHCSGARVEVLFPVECFDLVSDATPEAPPEDASGA